MTTRAEIEAALALSERDWHREVGDAQTHRWLRHLLAEVERLEGDEDIAVAHDWCDQGRAREREDMTLEQQIDALAAIAAANAEAEDEDDCAYAASVTRAEAADQYRRCWQAERKLREAERALEWVDPLSNGTAWDKHTALRAEVEAILRGEV